MIPARNRPNSVSSSWKSVLRDQQGYALLISKIMIVLMMGCLSFGYAQLIGKFTSHPYLTLPLFALIVSSEAIYTQGASTSLEGRDKFIFRAAEILTLIILLKLFYLLNNGWANSMSEVISWRDNFLQNFFTVDLLIALIILVPVWLVSTNLIGHIKALHEREEDASWDELGKVQNALHTIRARIISYIFSLGAAIVFMAVTARLNVRDYIGILRGRFDPAIPVTNVLLYFVLALVLLSLTQYALLRTRWLWEKTAVSPLLGRKWVLYSVLFCSGLAVLVFFLPTDYSLGFFDTLRYLLSLLQGLLQILLFLVMLPFTLCFQLFKVQTASPTPPAPAQSPVVTPAPVANSPSPFIQFLQSLLFWGLLVAVIVFALSSYIRANKDLWVRLSHLPALTWLIQAVQAVWAWFRGANRAAASLIRTSLARLRPQPGILRKLNQLPRISGDLTARQRVIQLYLAFIELGKQEGSPRQGHQTPYQYSQAVLAAHPEVTTEVLDVTEAFVEARYSQHEVQSEKLHTLTRAWELIRSRLRRSSS